MVSSVSFYFVFVRQTFFSYERIQICLYPISKYFACMCVLCRSYCALSMFLRLCYYIFVFWFVSRFSLQRAKYKVTVPLVNTNSSNTTMIMITSAIFETWSSSKSSKLIEWKAKCGLIIDLVSSFPVIFFFHSFYILSHLFPNCFGL